MNDALNEEQFRRMLDALVDGLWYDVTEAQGTGDLLEDIPLETTTEAVLRHIRTGVIGTPAEEWLRNWKQGK